MREISADIAIIGGGVGGCAAALAALRNGATVILTEETDWIGGQLTAQAVPPDEHPWIETHGATRLYREFRTRVREFYRRNYPLTSAAFAQPNLNPGNGNVSRLCAEPRVYLAVLLEMLQPFLSSGHLTLLTETRPLEASVDGDRVFSVTIRDLRDGEETVLIAPYFLDATERGDLLPMTGTEFVTGAEAQRDTNELHAPAEADPDNQQAFTVCFALEHREGEDHTISRPHDYDFWRDYVPAMTPNWPGKLLSLTMSNPFTLEPRPMIFDPIAEARDGKFGFWTYRRILDRTNFREGTFASDVCLVNWPQNDYWLGNLIGVSEDEEKTHLKRAHDLNLALVYWLQTEAPRLDGGTGWKGLRIRPDITGTAHGMAKSAYIREARRIRAEFTVTEAHVGTEQRMSETGLSKEEVSATNFADSVGVGAYRIDLHPTTKGNNYLDVSSLPFQIPLGALLPVRMENLLPACKNLGVTHITNGCYRLHPVEWNIGEAAGTLAAHCVQKSLTPRAIRHSAENLTDFQRLLRAQGVETAWVKPHAL